MSEIVRFASKYEIEDLIIVTGYIRGQYSDIPKDIIDLCVKYYHEIKDRFEHYASHHFALSDDKMKILCQARRQSIYGYLCIPSCSLSKHEWTFKVSCEYDGVGIGIDETEYLRRDGGNFTFGHGTTKLYGIWSSGETVQWDQPGIGDCYGTEFWSGSTIKMELDLFSESKTLSFTVDNNKKVIAFTNIATAVDITYCMIACCASKEDTIELLSYRLLQG